MTQSAIGWVLASGEGVVWTAATYCSFTTADQRVSGRLMFNPCNKSLGEKHIPLLSLLLRLPSINSAYKPWTASLDVKVNS